VSACQEGTRLIFRIDVDPRPLWLRLLARTMDFKNRHSHQMTKVFTRLRERMDAQHAQQREGAAPAAGSANGPATGPTAGAAVGGPAVNGPAVSGPTA
jgi:hypothetical protein